MRNIVFVGFMSILYACSPSSHSTEYSVSGVVSDSAANGKKIYILRYDDNQYIDSTVIEKNLCVVINVLKSVKSDGAAFLME